MKYLWKLRSWGCQLNVSYSFSRKTLQNKNSSLIKNNNSNSYANCYLYEESTNLWFEQCEHCVQGINDQYHNSYSNAECSKKHDFSSFCFSRWLLPVEFSMSKIIFIILKMIFYWVAILGKERLFLIHFANFRCTLYSKIRSKFL